jgi:hypothetical protein
MSVREALLKPKFQDWFPTITAGVWYVAARLAKRVMQQQREQPTWATHGRVLSEEHFLFRRGRYALRSAHPARREDL